MYERIVELMKIKGISPEKLCWDTNINYEEFLLFYAGIIDVPNSWINTIFNYFGVDIACI